MEALSIVINDSEREGSKFDVEILEKTFEEMGIEKVICNEKNVNQNMIKDRVSENAHKFENARFVIAVLMCHANETKEGTRLLKALISSVLRNKCLYGKLVWFIFQCCRGPSATEGDGEGDNYYAITYATSKGSYAERTDKGSVFIQEICIQLKSGNTTSLRKLLNDISNNVNKITDISHKQEVTYEINFKNGTDYSFDQREFYSID